jgi:predicted glycosyltransferase
MQRIALYSPGMVGLGHIRRTLLIAQALTAASRASALVIAEARQAGSFAIPAGVDMLTLPALRKADGQCTPRYLDVSLRKLLAMRSRAIQGTLMAFEPDVLIVDHLPRGAVGELEPALEQLRAEGHTRIVLGLRDILEAPETVRREWDQAGYEAAIRRYFDAVWVYGDRAVYDQAREYHFAPDVAARLSYAGYLDPVERVGAACDGDPLVALGLPEGRLALCMVGGGQDGEALALAFAQGAPRDMNSVVVTGPFMPEPARARLHELAGANPRLRVLEFLDEPTRLLRRADRLVAMGGYNTVCEALSFETHTLVVPRGQPRLEQRIRAERLRELGLLHVLPEEDLSPAAIGAWLARDLGAPPPVRERIDMHALTRLPAMLEAVLARPRLTAGFEPRASASPWGVAAD